jgi:F-type H+-transporting ATPase subunit b
MEIEVGAILAQILNFGILTGLLTFLLLKPIKSVLEARSRRIAEGQKAAEEALAEKAHIGELKAQAEKEAKQQAKTVLSGARKEADARREELMAEVKAEVEAARAKMLKTLDNEKSVQLKALQAQFEATVIEVAEQVVGQSLDSKKHAKLIEQGLQRIAASK